MSRDDSTYPALARRARHRKPNRGRGVIRAALRVLAGIVLGGGAALSAATAVAAPAAQAGTVPAVHQSSGITVTPDQMACAAVLRFRHVDTTAALHDDAALRRLTWRGTWEAASVADRWLRAGIRHYLATGRGYAVLYAPGGVNGDCQRGD
jgi:hypothetical protein